MKHKIIVPVTSPPDYFEDIWDRKHLCAEFDDKEEEQ
jgi:hypothetical protein